MACPNREIGHFILVPTGEEIVIPACSGTDTLAEAWDLFASIDPNFIGWGINKPSQSTAETKVSVHDLIKGVTFGQMFNTLEREMDERWCLTPAQIVEFVRSSRKWLRVAADFATLFSFRCDKTFFIAYVYLPADVDGLRLSLSHFGYINGWCGVRRVRLVVPKW